MPPLRLIHIGCESPLRPHGAEDDVGIFCAVVAAVKQPEPARTKSAHMSVVFAVVVPDSSRASRFWVPDKVVAPVEQSTSVAVLEPFGPDLLQCSSSRHIPSGCATCDVIEEQHQGPASAGLCVPSLCCEHVSPGFVGL